MTLRFPRFPTVYTEHLRIPVGAGSLHAERVGRGGHPVVLLHGFGTCSFLWRALAPRLADQGYTAIALDLLGHGESDRPLDMSFALAAQAEYVERALTALRLPAVSLIGQDLGGVVGLLLAAQRSRRVQQLAIINPPDLDDLPGPEIRTLQRTSARAALSANSLFGALTLLEPLLRAGVSDPAHMSDRLVARYLAPWVGSDGVGELLQMAAAIDLPVEDRPWLRDVKAPTTIIHGALDRWTTPDVIQRLVPALSAAQPVVTTIASAGRLVPEDAPEELLRFALGWLPPNASGALPPARAHESPDVVAAAQRNV